MIKPTSRKGISNRVQVDYTTKSIFPLFREQCKNDDVNATGFIKEINDYKVYKKVINLFFKKLIHKVLYEALEVKLPYGLGSVMVEKRKMWFKRLNYHKKLRIDWGRWLKEEVIVYHLNEHRQYYKYRLAWKRGTRGNMKNYRIYFNRNMKRELAYILKNNNSIDYYEKC